MECKIIFTVFKAFVKDLDANRGTLQEGTSENEHPVCVLCICW